jgi:hypothetical protein
LANKPGSFLASAEELVRAYCFHFVHYEHYPVWSFVFGWQRRLPLCDAAGLGSPRKRRQSRPSLQTVGTFVGRLLKKWCSGWAIRDLPELKNLKGMPTEKNKFSRANHLWTLSLQSLSNVVNGADDLVVRMLLIVNEVMVGAGAGFPRHLESATC